MPEAGELRKVPLFVALGLVVLVVALEVGGAAVLRAGGDAAEATRHVTGSQAFQELPGPVNDPNSVQARTLASVEQAALEDEPPGLGIPYLALIDGILAYTLLLTTLALVMPDRLQAKVQGIVTLVGSILLILGTIVLILLALAQLLIMISLFFAPPFGTIAYMAVWGTFPKGAAAVVLGLVLALKIGASVCLPIAHQRFLQNKGLVLLILTSLLATIIVSFLHGLVPFALVSITDAVAAIIVGILAIIWAIVLLIGSIIAVFQAVTTS